MDNYLLSVIADLLNLRSQSGHTARSIRKLLLWIVIAGVAATVLVALIAAAVT